MQSYQVRPQTEYGAGNGLRSRGRDLGKVALYQLSYSRKNEWPTCSPAYRSRTIPCHAPADGAPRQRSPAPDKGDGLGWATATHPTPCHRLHDDLFQHSELLKITTSADRGHKGVSRRPERKNPGSAFCGHQPGFSCDPREVPACSGNLPDMSLEVTSYHSLFHYWDGDRMRLGRVHGFLRPTRAIPDRQTHTRRRTPDY